MKEITIESIIHIPVGKKIIFSAKEIHLNADIHCEGKLVFDRCIIEYDYNKNTHKINIEKSGSVIISHSTIVGTCNGELQGSSEYFIQTNAYGIPKLTVTDSIFNDCYLFASSVSAHLENCKILYSFLPSQKSGRQWHFIYAWGDDSEIKNCIIENTSNWFEKHESLVALRNKWQIDGINESTDESTIMSLIRDFLNMPVEKYDNDAVMAEIERYGEKYGDDFYISDVLFHDVKIVEKTTFKNNVQPCFYGANKITNSIFSHCCRVSDDYGAKSYFISDCLFDHCKDVIGVGEKGTVQHCRFINCTGELIKTDSGTRIAYCEFYNIHTDELFSFRFGRGGKIEYCKFDGFSGNYLISCGTIVNEKDIHLTVDHCVFKNCHSKKGILIDEYSSYCGFFSTKTIKPMYISNCHGLENVNKEGDKADAIPVRTETASGEPIGARLDDATVGVPGYDKKIKDRPYEAKYQQYAEALDRLKEEFNQKWGTAKGVTDEVLEHLDSRQKKEL
jgi:hypothetical protein